MASLAEFSVFVDENHKQRETIEALQNLIYLIGMDAGYPDRVKTYVQHAERVIRRGDGCVLLN